MLHRYATETCALLVWAAFFVLLVTTVAFLPDWWSARSNWEVLVGLVSCCYASRLVASGKSCQWPRGVDFTGRVALVTGASSGVGYACAEELALHGFTVILAGRHLERLLTARQRIQRRLAKPSQKGRGKEGGKGGHVLVLGKVDLSDEESIREYAATVAAAAKHYPLSLLINAAGIMNRELRYTATNWPAATVPVSETEKDPSRQPRPLEQMLAANAVGPMLLTQLLLPVLSDTASSSGITSRIVNVASSCHSFLGPALSSDAFDPIQMIVGLERRTEEQRREGEEGEGKEERAGRVTAMRVAPRYNVDGFHWSTFVGYYGLSKLCVIWNTRLLARQVAAMTFDSPGKGANAARKGERGNGATGQRESSGGSAAAQGCREQKLFVACTHPGVSTTHLYRELFPQWMLDYIIYWPSLLVGKTWRESAQSTLKAAIEDTHMVQGGYYLDGGEYGEQSGVNCLSSHASSGAAMMRYGQWLREKIVDTTPRPYTSVSAKELSTSSAPVTTKSAMKPAAADPSRTSK